MRNTVITEPIVATLFLGIALGIGLHRLIMILVLERLPLDMCAYCEWLGRRKNRRNKRRKS